MYDGEEGKRADYAASLPPFLLREIVLPHLYRGGWATILAEEWHTVDAVLHLDWLLRSAGVRDQRHDRLERQQHLLSRAHRLGPVGPEPR